MCELLYCLNGWENVSFKSKKSKNEQNRKEKKRKKAPSTSGESVGKKERKIDKKVQRKKTMLERAKNSNIQK